jgi:hypothetical protein
VDTPSERKTAAQLIEDEKAFLAKMEADRQARLAAAGGAGEGGDQHPAPAPRRVPRNVDDELPPFAAPWE